MTDGRKPRIVRCTIEMELREFEHFNVLEDELSDEEITKLAETMFEEAVAVMNPEERLEWIQSKIIEDSN